MIKAVFLDRDGVVNLERGEYTYKIDDFILNDGLIDFLKNALSKEYSIFIISNQGGIAKGIYSKNDVEKLHEYFVSQLKERDIKIHEIYYCPHHQDYGKCLCRKPDSIMLEKAISKFNISIENSIFIGDRERDLVAATKVGIKGIKINSNENLVNYINKLA